MQVVKLGMSVIYKRNHRDSCVLGTIVLFPTGRSLESEGSPPPVPDRDATEMLLGTALGALVMARRFLKS